MSTSTSSIENKRESLVGILALVAAVIAAASTAIIGLTSFTNFNPPNWLRIITMAPLPFAILLSLGFGIAGLTKKPGRAWAVAGLVLAGLSIIAFVVMILVGG